MNITQVSECDQSGRYVYHYCASISNRNDVLSGIAQLPFRIVSKEDLDMLKKYASTDDYKVIGILSLTYLGREFE